MIWRLYRTAEEYMQGWPEEVLTIALILCALIIIGVAIRGSAVAKAAALVWVALP